MLTEMEKHTFMKCWVVGDRGAPPDSILLRFPPSKAFTFANKSLSRTDMLFQTVSELGQEESFQHSLVNALV